MGANYVFGGLNSWINHDVPFKQAFSLRNANFVTTAGVNSAGQFSNPVSTAYNTEKAIADNMAAFDNEMIEKLDAQLNAAYRAQDAWERALTGGYSGGSVVSENGGMNWVSKAWNWTKEHGYIDGEFRTDYGPQAELYGKIFGFKLGLHGEKDTKPFGQINLGYNKMDHGGFYSFGYGYGDPYYGNINNPIRTSWGIGLLFWGYSETYESHRDVFKVGNKMSSTMNWSFFEIKKHYMRDGSHYKTSVGFNFGSAASLIIGYDASAVIGFQFLKN